MSAETNAAAMPDDDPDGKSGSGRWRRCRRRPISPGSNLTLRPRIERQVVFDGDFRTFKKWRFACSPVLGIKDFNGIIAVLDELTALDPALDPGREIAPDAEPAMQVSGVDDLRQLATKIAQLDRDQLGRRIVAVAAT